MAFMPRDSAGLEIVDDWSGIGQRTTASGTIHLDEVAVEAALVIPTPASDKPTLRGPVSQLIQAAIDGGIARGAFDEACAFVRQHSRPWVDAGVERNSDDPHLQADVGRVWVEITAADALLRRAARFLDEVDPASLDAATAARASIVVAEAKVLTTQAALKASEKLLEWGGSRATLAEHNLDRHWRNARTHTLHDPIRWKFHAIGNYYLNLNAFNMNCVGHIHHGMWTHPLDRSTEFNDLRYWLDLARTLERGLFDGLFIADILGVYDVYQQGIALTASESVQLPVNDPLMLVSAMASVTEHLGFGLTANLSYEAPYPFARRFSTLDHLTNGRVGWNIVTGYLDSAARAMGQPQLLGHDERYDQAEEFLDVSYQLWEGSWQEGAVLADRQQRRYADAAKIHPVRHHGKYYQLEGYHP